MRTLIRWISTSIQSSDKGGCLTCNFDDNYYGDQICLRQARTERPEA
ncbi:MAG: hypothetical protein AAGA91_00060 [Pseudomonadota bacterium]